MRFDEVSMAGAVEVMPNQPHLHQIHRQIVDALGDQATPLMRHLALNATTDGNLTSRYRAIVMTPTDEEIIQHGGCFVLTTEWLSLECLPPPSA